MMFPHTVTIYNRDSSEAYHRTVLSGVLWNSIRGAVMRKTGTSSADGLQLIVPMFISGYLPPKEWQALADKSNNWTLQPKDIVALGTHETALSSAKDARSFEDVLTINTIDTKKFGSGMDHWEVSGR